MKFSDLLYIGVTGSSRHGGNKPYRRFFLNSSLALGILLSASPLYSQTLPDSMHAQMSVTLSEITVTSTRHPAAVTDIALPVAVVEARQLEKLPSPTLPEAIGRLPGVALIRDGIWATTVSIRGLSRSSVVVMVDGNRIETANDLSAGLSMIDMNSVERVEVIKGGASALYGTGAMGGVVNVITGTGGFSPGFRLSGSAAGQYSAVNRMRSASLSLSASSARWYAGFSGTLRKADDTRTPGGKLLNSRFSDNSVLARAGIMPYTNSTLDVNYQRFYAEDVGIPGGAPIFPSQAILRYPSEKRELFSVTARQKNISALLRNLSLKYFHQYIKRDVENIPGIVRKLSAPPRQVEVLKITPAADHTTNGFELQSDWLLGSSQYLIAGAEAWQRNYRGLRLNYQRITVFNPDGTTVKSVTNKVSADKPIPDSYYRSVGAFLQDEIKLIENSLSISAGGRIDRIVVNNKQVISPVYELTNGVPSTPAKTSVIWREGDESDMSWSFNLGALYRISGHISLTLNAARSFRSPSLEERYQYIDQGGSLRVGNPALEPEKGYFFDLGLRHNSQIFNFSGSLFLNIMRDLVAEAPGRYDTLQALVKKNIGKARLYGYDIGADAALSDEYSIYGSVSYVRGEDTENNTDLPQIAPLNASAGIRGWLKYFGFDAMMQYFAKQDRTAPGEIRTPDYAVFNLYLNSMALDLGAAALRVNTGVENIFDRSYRNHLSTNRGLMTLEPGRNIFVKLQLLF